MPPRHLAEESSSIIIFGGQDRSYGDRTATGSIVRLSDGWIVTSGGMQWILRRQRSKARGGWVPVSFVASTKAILERCIRESGAKCCNAGHVALNALPDTFKEWRRRHTKTQAMEMSI